MTGKVLKSSAMAVLACGAVWGTRLPAFAQTNFDYYTNSLGWGVTVAVDRQTPAITLNFPTNIPSSAYVYRKDIDRSTWGAGVTLPVGTVTYRDTNVVIGSKYEYRVSGRFVECFYSGIDVPDNEWRGKVVLAVVTNAVRGLDAELDLFQRDLVGDGWTVIRHDIGTNLTPAQLKAVVKADYDADTNNVKALILIGRAPIAMSGKISPDGHSVREMPADSFYADLDGRWDGTGRVGYYSNNVIPTAAELQVGRIDLVGFNNYLFGKSEQDLMRGYFAKDHRFRHALVQPDRKGVIVNGYNDTPWRSMAEMLGARNVTGPVEAGMGHHPPILRQKSFLWYYMFGNASAQATFDEDPQAVFTQFFRSYVADWEYDGKLLRSILAAPSYALTSLYGYYGGGPTFHHMGLNETVGFGLRQSQNQPSNYSLFGVDVKHSLMGDPTLRLFTVTPPGEMRAIDAGGGVLRLSWTASTDDNIAGYHVFRATSSAGPFVRLNASLITGTSYDDPSPLTGRSTYMVRAIKLETSNSGTFWNLSQGRFYTINRNNNGLWVGVSDQNDPAFLVSPAGLTLTADAGYAGGNISKVSFYDGPELLGDDATSPYSFSWTQIPAGVHTITAVVLDGAANSVTSGAVTVKVRNPQPPVAAMRYPTNLVTKASPATFRFEAKAGDPDGRIVKVDYYINSQCISTGRYESDIWVTTWTTNVPGFYDIYVVATDNSGLTGASAPVRFEVSADNILPTVSITIPSTNYVQKAAPYTVQFESRADDADGTVTTVQYYADGVLVASASYNPWGQTWGPVPVGTYSVRAVALDNSGGAATSMPVTIVITADNTPPTIAITSPPSGTNINASQAVTVKTSASDIDGNVAKVQFLLDGVLRGEDTGSPYEYSLSCTNGGVYTITARAVDNLGATADATVIVNVNATPKIYFVRPLSLDCFGYPGVVPIELDAWDPDGTIARVFVCTNSSGGAGNGGATGQIWATNRPPYAFEWNPPTNKTYYLWAYAVDNLGATTSVNVIISPLSSTDTPPAVSMTNPTNNASFVRPDSIELVAEASYVNGSISNVQFYADGRAIGVVSNAPYSLAWTNPPLGQHVLTARAKNSRGYTLTSAGVRVNIRAGAENSAPVITGFSPASPLTIPENSNMVFSVQATDADFDRLQYTWKLDGSTLARQNNSGFFYVTDYSSAGDHTVQAVVADGCGGVTACTWLVHVSNVNRRPVANSTNLLTITNMAGNITLTGSDPDGEPIVEYRKVSGPSHGTVIVNGSIAQYMPAPGYFGADQFDFVAGDGQDESQPATVFVTIERSLAPFIGTGNGLKGEYYDNADLTSQKVERIDRVVDFDWNARAPDASMGIDNFSVRWTGRVQPSFSGRYTFYTVSDDGVRLWVNGQLVIDNWTTHGSTENSGTVNVQVGVKYNIRMEYFQGNGGAVARLLWSSASQAKQVIPVTQLYSTMSNETTDENSNRIPDQWEIDNFGGTNVLADADADGDGMSNYAEYIAGTDPANASSLLAISADMPASGSASDLVLRWSSVSNRFYAIKSATDLMVGFTVTNAAHLAATPPMNTHTVAVGQLADLFYRIVVE